MSSKKKNQMARGLGVLIASLLVCLGTFIVFQYFAPRHTTESSRLVPGVAELGSPQLLPGGLPSSETQKSSASTRRKPGTESSGEGNFNEKPLTEADIQALVQGFSNPQDYATNKARLFRFSKANKFLVFAYLTKKLAPPLDLPFVVRALDILRMLYEDNPQLPQREVLPILQNFLSDKNPLLVRGSLRALAALSSEEALKILARNLNQEDSAISAEIMNHLNERSRRQDSTLRDMNLDQDIMRTLEYYRRSGQNNLEINTAALRALIGIKGNQTFDYLAEQLNKPDINLDLKNEIALGLTAWGPRSLPQLQRYLRYLKSLRPETNPLVDQTRLQGILQTQNAIQRLQN